MNVGLDVLPVFTADWCHYCWHAGSSLDCRDMWLARDDVRWHAVWWISWI